MRGYFGIGGEGIANSGNLGALARTAHAFGAAFVFSVGTAVNAAAMRIVDTSDTAAQLPFYRFADAGALLLPAGCVLVGVELLDEAIALPSFRHPLCAAYVLGPERGCLTPAMVARCAHVVKIPTRFCLNVSLAGALVLYDRMLCLGRFAERPVRPGGPLADPPSHVHGAPRHRAARRAAARALQEDSTS